jgi:hypothetical protein
MDIQSGFARRMWHHIEAIHAYLYYAPEVFAQAEELGFAIDTRWPSYFAWRTAPLGAAGRELVTAVCYSFSPSMVAEHIPAAWQLAQPADVLRARLHASRGQRRPALVRAAAPDSLASDHAAA